MLGSQQLATLEIWLRRRYAYYVSLYALLSHLSSHRTAKFSSASSRLRTERTDRPGLFRGLTTVNIRVQYKQLGAGAGELDGGGLRSPLLISNIKTLACSMVFSTGSYPLVPPSTTLQNFLGRERTRLSPPMEVGRASQRDERRVTPQSIIEHPPHNYDRLLIRRHSSIYSLPPPPPREIASA